MGRSLNLATNQVTSSTTSVGGDPSSIVSVTAADGFNTGDPVFMTTDTGEVLNLNTIPAALALAAGRADDAWTNPTAGNSGLYGTSTSIQLADGSIVVGSAVTGNGTPTYCVELHKYNTSGAITVSKQYTPLTSDVSATAGYPILMALLSNGNIGFIYTAGINTLQANWVIVNPTTLDVLYSGSNTAATTANNSTNFYLQPTNEGGFVYFNATGFYRVTGAGVHSTLTTAAGLPFHNNTGGNLASSLYSSNAGTSTVATQPMSISSGGFGWIATNGTNVVYVRVNADGSLRGTTTIVATYTSDVGGGLFNGGYYSKVFGTYARATGGNIAWIYGGTTGSKWGIIDDTGATVLASTALTALPDVNEVERMNVCNDNNGCFMISYHSTSTTLGINYVSSTGTPKATWPKSLSTYDGATVYGSRVWMIPSSVGMYLIAPSSANQAQYSVVTNAGAMTVTAANLPTQGNVQYPAVYMAFNLVSDNLYILQHYFNGGAGGPGTTSCLVKLDTSGTMSTSFARDSSTATFNQNSTFCQWFNSAVVGDDLIFGGGQYVRVYSLSTLLVKQAITVSSFWNGLGHRHLVYPGRHIIISLTGTGGGSLNGGLTAKVIARVKYNPTVLLGVATIPAAAGSKVTVGTKGIFNTTWSVAQTFDQSAANPKGNKGSIAGSVMSLVGLF